LKGQTSSTKLTQIRRRKQKRKPFKNKIQNKVVYTRIVRVIIIIIQFNLFPCRLNSPEANYKAITSRNEKTYSYKQYKNKAIMIIIIALTQN
jgi:hypothetical protein